MKMPLMVVGAAAGLVLASVGVLALAGVPISPVSFASAHTHPGADMDAMHGGMAGDAHNAQLGMQRLAFPQSTGSVPSADEAKHLEQVSFLQIAEDREFTPANGVRSGTGTLDDPYVISGYDVTGDLDLQDTNACFEVVGNWIDGALRLNWNGNCVHVHHNFIRDLRVNENIQRVGLDTGGLIELNQINYVGQIRHYDGEFRNNVVGPRQDDLLAGGVFRDPENAIPFLKDTRVLNIDGWNEAIFAHNTITGSVDLKLHGHHHSTGFLATHSHYHGDNETEMAMMDHDHTDRWTSVVFEDNKIIDNDGYGLRYSDEAHAGDDRTANSESTKQLDDDHQHHTWVTIQRNQLEGSGIIVDIFNADDELHKVVNPGWLTIQDNTIALTQRDPGLLGEQFFGPRFQPNTAITIWQAKEVQLKVLGNQMTYTASSQSSNPLDPVQKMLPFLYEDTTATAIRIDGVRDANLMLHANVGKGFVDGINARSMDNRTMWYLMENDFPGAQHQVYYDASVDNKPQTGMGPDIPVEQYGSSAPDEPTSQHDHNHPK